MARTRTIKPEFWDDEKLATVSRDARLTFIGIWTNSDDYGVVKGHPAWLKNTIFPYDDIRIADFQKWLKELESLCCIIQFENNGEKYYHIKNFAKHQTINRPSQAKNPSPPDSIINHSLNTHGALIDETETETETETENKEPALPKKTKYLDSVLLTDSEYEKLQEALGQKNLENGIEQLDYSITVKGGKYKDHYKTLLNWFKRGFISDGNGNNRNNSADTQLTKPKTYEVIDPSTIMDRQRIRDEEEARTRQ